MAELMDAPRPEAHPHISSPEELVWSGSPSQVLNVPAFVLCILLFWLVVPIFIGAWKWLVLRNIRYELTTERLRIRSGVLNKELEELELYRVRDYKLERPVFRRLFSLGNVIVTSTDVSQPIVTLSAIPDSEGVREQIRRYVEDCRMKKRVRMLDVQ
jgi:uncharacterized membrane protein YdbT with pleckstrin-like domain